MTVLEAIQKSSDFLSKKGIESARLQAEHLLAHLLKMPRMNLYLNFQRLLSEGETAALRALVQRRGGREPLQHIVGTVSFCGFELMVNRNVLVPRPETEVLAELGWEFLLSLGRPALALDVGTGSGCLSVALAAKCPNAKITATDAAAAALALARENAKKNGMEERIDFFEGDGFAALPDGKTFDLIVSNPPYVPSDEIGRLEPEVRDFDPRAALDGGADGLDFYRKFAAQAAIILKPSGKFMVEFGDGQAAAVRAIFEAEKWIVEAVKDDYSGRARVLAASPNR
ncbi:MAG: peptide chain release factor N(5)-glutamine methyltransferase [Verrucomicrobia bacterium]|nr:peptide chain release factor N(5)-glutamine methyltransferase [Verrucomicrobiota bacterium]MDE3099044.1 peptide chain release factor N(5)-glutamine methyltransferase [Verrucomicrobiota bacterium]